MAEPGRLLSMGSHRVGNDWSDLAAAAAAVQDSYDAGFGKTPPSFLYSSRGSHSKNTGEVCHNFLQWTMFGQSSPYDPSILSGPARTSWLIASLSYSSTFPWQGSDWCWRRFLRVTWTARRSNQSILWKSTLNIHWKDWCWSSNTLATWCKETTHYKRPWYWDRLKTEGE